MKKKIIALMMGAILTMGMFTGCGESGETASTPSSTPAESTPAESAAESKAEESTAASGKVYKIACDQAYAPFSIQADDGTYYGIDVEILAAVAEIEGFEYELCPMDFSGIIPALVSGTIDGSIAGMNITEERKESVDFSDGYYESGSSLVVNKDDDSIASFEDLSGKVAACKEGTTGQLQCEDHADEYGFTVTVFPDSVSMMMAVANKQADFLIEDYPVISYQISIGEQADLKVAIEAIETAPQNGFAVKKGENAVLLAMFNDGLAKIRESGKYDEIVNQYK